MLGAHSGHCIILPILMLKNAFKKHPLQNRTNVQIKGGGVKGLLNNVKKTALFWKDGFPKTLSTKPTHESVFHVGVEKISCILYFLTTEIDRHHSVDLTYIIDHHPRQTHTLFVRLVVRGVWQSVETVESCKGAGRYKTNARGGADGSISRKCLC